MILKRFADTIPEQQPEKDVCRLKRHTDQQKSILGNEKTVFIDLNKTK